jgi:hypothetical protein
LTLLKPVQQCCNAVAAICTTAASRWGESFAHCHAPAKVASSSSYKVSTSVEPLLSSMKSSCEDARIGWSTATVTSGQLNKYQHFAFLSAFSVTLWD